MSDLISVVVPIYNVEKYLTKCIDSIINQTYKNLEIILVDDGSPDNCGKICDEYKRKDSRIVVYHQSNKGVSASRNFGLSKSNGEYVIFVDSDDILNKNMIEVLHKNIKYYKADISVCGYNYIEKNYVVNVYNTKKIIQYTKKEGLVSFFNENSFGVGIWNKLFKKEIIKNVFFDENIKVNEDKKYLFDVIMKSNKIIYEDQCLYNYIKRMDSVSGEKFSSKKLDIIKVNDYIEKQLKKMEVNDKNIEISFKKNKLIYLIRLIREFKLSADDKEYRDNYHYIKSIFNSAYSKEILLNLNNFEKIECIIFKYLEFIYYPLFYFLTKLKILKIVKNKLLSMQVK